MKDILDQIKQIIFNIYWIDTYHHVLSIILIGTLILLFALTLNNKSSYTVRLINYISFSTLVVLLIVAPYNDINVVTGLWFNADQIYLLFYLFGGMFVAVSLANVCELSFVKENKDIEYPMLVIMGLLSTLLLMGTTNLMAAFIALECLAFLSYVLVAFERSNKLSSQAGVRYLFIGSIPTGLLVFGTIELFSSTGTFNMNDASILLKDQGFNEILTVINQDKTPTYKRQDVVDVHMYGALRSYLDLAPEHAYKFIDILDTTIDKKPTNLVLDLNNNTVVWDYAGVTTSKTVNTESVVVAKTSWEEANALELENCLKQYSSSLKKGSQPTSGEILGQFFPDLYTEVLGRELPPTKDFDKVGDFFTFYMYHQNNAKFLDVFHATNLLNQAIEAGKIKGMEGTIKPGFYVESLDNYIILKTYKN